MAKKKTKERVKRNNVNIQPNELMAPIDLKSIMVGDSDDPCFGKLRDETNDCCARCGDSIPCGLAMQKRLQDKRESKKIKNNTKEYTDAVEIPTFTETDENKLEKFVKSSLRKEKSKLWIIMNAKKKFGAPKDKVKKLIKSLKK